MPRTGFVFIAVCMVLIAASSGALVVAVAGAGLAQGAVVALTLLLMMVIGHLASQRQRDREDAAASYDSLALQIDTLSNDITMLAQRVDRFELLAMDKARLATAPIAAEIDVLGGLVKQFAETLETHETAIHQTTHMLHRREAELRAQQRMLDTAPLPAPAMEPEPETEPAASNHDKGAPLEDAIVSAPPVASLLERIERAAANNRMDLYLQPIVTLPQRKVRWYEAQTRLRDEHGSVIEQSEWRGAAEAAGVHATIDRQALMRSVQMVRRLVSRMRDAGMVVTMAGASLADPAFAAEVDAYLVNTPSLSRILVLQLARSDFDGLGPAERKLVRRLGEAGYRFALDDIDDLSFDAKALAARNVRLLKAPAALIVAESERRGAPTHPADIAAELGRNGIELVASDIDTESLVLDLIDFDVPLAQGSLFSMPKAVPADLLAQPPATVVKPPPAANAPPVRVTPKAAAAGQGGTLGAAVLGALREEAVKRPAGIGPGLKALIKSRLG